MSPVPEHVTAALLAEVLLEWSRDSAESAALTLLAQHNGDGHWLTNPSFRGCVGWEESEGDGGSYPEGCAVVDWSAVKWLLVKGPGPASPSEVSVLTVAHSIARGALSEAAVRCDVRNWALIVAAITSVRGEV